MAQYVILVNESEKRVESVKIGFSWVCFFWMWIFALPLFLRRVYPWAFAIAGIQLLLYIAGQKYGFAGIDCSFLGNFTEASDTYPFCWYIYQGPNPWGSLLTFAMSFYLGFRGNEITARYYLKNGYQFAEPDSIMVKLAKIKWHMQV